MKTKPKSQLKDITAQRIVVTITVLPIDPEMPNFEEREFAMSLSLQDIEWPDRRIIELAKLCTKRLRRSQALHRAMQAKPGALEPKIAGKCRRP